MRPLYLSAYLMGQKCVQETGSAFPWRQWCTTPSCIPIPILSTPFASSIPKDSKTPSKFSPKESPNLQIPHINGGCGGISEQHGKCFEVAIRTLIIRCNQVCGHDWWTLRQPSTVPRYIGNEADYGAHLGTLPLSTWNPQSVLFHDLALL